MVKLALNGKSSKLQNHTMRRIRVLCLWLLVWPVVAGFAADWPAYLRDLDRSAVAPDPVTLRAKPAWVADTGHAPSPGFYPELRSQTLGPQKLLAPSITFDYAYAPVIADGRLYFGSSTEEALYCLDARSGQRRWTFYAEGAIRLAPTVWSGKVYFGSDDGRVYALDAATGKLAWKFDAAPDDYRVIANGRLASQWPVRTAATIRDGILYFSAGLFPATGGVGLYALNAETGALLWKKQIPLPANGYILAAEETLFVPNGRAAPAEYSPKDGSPLFDSTDLRREGGGAFVARFDDVVYFGPTEFGIVRFRVGQPSSSAPPTRGLDNDPKRKIRGAMTGLAGWRVAVAGNVAYFLRDDGVTALPYEQFRKTLQDSAEKFSQRVKAGKITTKSSVQFTTDAVAESEMAGYAKWKAPVKGGRSLVVAGNLVVVGAENVVVGFDPASGEEKFRADVDGTVWELAAAGGRLYASAGAGKLYCFGGEPASPTSTEVADLRSEPLSRYAATALKKAGRTKGYCFVIGAGEARLAAEIARQSEMKVVCVERDAETARAAQQRLAAAGLYGDRVVVRHHPDGRLPYAPYIANLIVSESAAAAGRLDFPASDVYRLLQPFGGALVLVGAPGHWGKDLAGWDSGAKEQTILRGKLPGAGEWTHMFADPANTSCSGDGLIGGALYRLQWFGDPSPPRNAGWHNNGMGPLYKDGRIFQIKLDNVEAVDAYNGTSLWSADAPGATRFSPGREGGSACVDDARLYWAVKNDCQIFDVATGKKLQTFFGPDADKDKDWGYIAVQGDLLFGTKQSAQATTGLRDRLKAMWTASEAQHAVSTSLFALDKNTGAARWRRAGDGRAILNSTITIDQTRVYFVESREPSIARSESGSVWLRDFLKSDAFLVALDLQTGKPVWEQPFEFRTRTMLYVSHYRGRLIISGGYHEGPLANAEPTDKATSQLASAVGDEVTQTRIKFAFQCRDAATGALKWNADYVSTGQLGAQHNYNVTHPVITGGKIYHAPSEQHIVTVDLDTGKLTELSNIKRGKGCATPTGSARAMFYRSLGIASFDFETQQQFYVSSVNRPSCWMNVLPAGGIVQMPEYSIGCNCAFPLQTSIVLLPTQEDLPHTRAGLDVRQKNESGRNN
jgi:outer membrane protein assembly factor BamB